MLIERMVRAARLDPELFNEVEHDETATGQAVGVVLIVALCTLIGQAIGGTQTQGIIGAGIGALLYWLLQSLILLGVGKLLGGTADFGEVMRALAFAYTPGVLYILSGIPLLGGLAAFAAWVWTLIATVIAVREAMDFDTGKAVLTVAIPVVIFIGLAIVLGTIFGLALFAALRMGR